MEQHESVQIFSSRAGAQALIDGTGMPMDALLDSIDSIAPDNGVVWTALAILVADATHSRENAGHLNRLSPDTTLNISVGSIGSSQKSSADQDYFLSRFERWTTMTSSSSKDLPGWSLPEKVAGEQVEIYVHSDYLTQSMVVWEAWRSKHKKKKVLRVGEIEADLETTILVRHLALLHCVLLHELSDMPFVHHIDHQPNPRQRTAKECFLVATSCFESCLLRGLFVSFEPPFDTSFSLTSQITVTDGLNHEYTTNDDSLFQSLILPPSHYSTHQVLETDPALPSPRILHLRAVANAAQKLVWICQHCADGLKMVRQKLDRSEVPAASLVQLPSHEKLAGWVGDATREMRDVLNRYKDWHLIDSVSEAAFASALDNMRALEGECALLSDAINIILVAESPLEEVTFMSKPSAEKKRKEISAPDDSLASPTKKMKTSESDLENTNSQASSILNM